MPMHSAARNSRSRAGHTKPSGTSFLPVSE
jgi:hypothetical protein